MQRNGTVLDLVGIHLEVVQIVLERRGHLDGHARWDAVHFEIPDAIVFLFQFLALLVAGGVLPGRLRLAVQHIALVRRGAHIESVGGHLAVIVLLRLARVAIDRAERRIVILCGVLLAIVGDQDRVGDDDLGLADRRGGHVRRVRCAGKAEADHGGAALVGVEPALGEVEAVLAVTALRQLLGLLLTALIVDHVSGTHLVAILRRGLDGEGIDQRVLRLFDLDLTMLRVIRQQAVFRALEVVCLVGLFLGTLDGVLVLLLLLPLGGGCAVGDVLDVGIGLGFHPNVRRGHSSARVDDGLVVVVRHRHRQGSGQLELALVALLVGFAFLEFSRNADVRQRLAL